MALKLSTGLRNALLDGNPLDTIMNGGLIKVYSGTVPLSADEAASSGALLLTISLNDTGSGISFEVSATDGVLEKASGETWSGTVAADGTATYYRHVAALDTGAQSTTEARIQGVVAVSGGDMNFDDVALVNTTLETLTEYSVTMPAS